MESSVQHPLDLTRRWLVAMIVAALMVVWLPGPAFADPNLVPQNLDAEVVEDEGFVEVALTWQAPLETVGLLGYRVYRAVGGGRVRPDQR